MWSTPLDLGAIRHMDLFQHRWHLNSKPYDVQTAALKMSNHKTHYAYFMEMGLGKTAICWSEFIDLTTNNLVNFMLVVCPNSLKSNWISEAEKQGVQNLIPSTWPNILPDTDMMAINYEALITRKGQKYLSNITKQKSVYLVFDESIHLKNPRAKRTKMAIGLAKECPIVRVLSGAPVTQSSMDLWGQLKVINGVGKLNPYAFRNRFCVMGGYLGKQVVGSRNEDELETILDKYSFRAKKKDWTDLPPKSFTIRSYIMKDKQLANYNQMHKEFLIQLDDDSITAPMAITQAMKLQQISSGFVIDEEGNTHLMTEEGKNPKILLTQEIVDETPNKVIVFAYYKKSIEMLNEAFKDNSCCITGGMSNVEIELAKQQFNEGNKKIMVCQLTAGKYGHTLLGTNEYPCHTSIYFENNYDLDARLQSEDRNHRHGQLRPVTYVDLIGSSMDKKIIDALVKKQNVAESIMTTT